mmetsp:Transcript_17260/g.37777  ORF Transcript_17260/g.37777 Transcript_17260/m.37777 type:complete len:587 (-) Transcript_17260:115-1875(-)|eukprot:CAMPEP_0168170338 /NCGR_PEP_ID=MMETSP0139_2-20121125/4123_1 /TAXON_ID=44445 /ORGANISM="Pseudo-nitzschia australis, Strain 10249 10 AB" /LENGTH=586 /DNA_ID=CAMNT_0008087827 /DNA_START=186 /DNA_END=1946 /DNA_ORIENTATION=+
MPIVIDIEDSTKTFEEEAEGIEARPESSSASAATAVTATATTTTTTARTTRTTGGKDPAFVVLPALQRSESFIRRRVKKRQDQEDLVGKKESDAKLPQSNENVRDSNPVDLDELEEEEQIRRYSNHGTWGVLESSRNNNHSGRYPSYRREQLVKEIDSANKRGQGGHAEVLHTLRNARILVYIIDARTCVTLAEVVDGIRRLVDHMRLDREHRKHPKDQKCLLYRDYDGRLFNLVLTSEYSNMEGNWRGNLESFSVVQAATLLTFLMRSMACAFDLEGTDNFRQMYLVLILGLVFAEEISLSWTNVALLVRGFPSMSAYALNSNLAGTDWLRKLMILIFAVASASTDVTFQKLCTLGGIILTCLVLLANLGSLSWKYMHWAPFRGLSCCGTGGSRLDPIFAFMAAILTGFCFPFMGHSTVEAGGAAAMESVMRIAVIVAGLFILSDYDAFQRLLVIGSEACNQDYINFFVGSWWSLSLMASLTLLYRRETRKNNEFDPYKRDCRFPNDEEPLLEEERTSPTGYKVPHLPLFPVNPSTTNKGIGLCSCTYQLGLEYVFSLLVAVGVGAFICYLGVTHVDDQFLSNNF